MPFLCSSYKHSSPRQEPITCQGSCNRPKSRDAMTRTSTYKPEESLNTNSCQSMDHPVNTSDYNKGRYIDNCHKNMARFSVGFDVHTATVAADHGPSSSAVSKRVFCTAGTATTETRKIAHSSERRYVNYVQALLCYVALNVAAAVFLGNKPIMPAFFASQFCGAMTIIYWGITGTLPI